METRQSDTSLIELKKAEPCYMNRKQIEDEAFKFAQKIKYEPAGDLEKIVTEILGGEIVYQAINDWEKSHEASIQIYAPKEFKINLSNFHGPLRNRFSLAHELGHYVLHSNEGIRPIKAARFGSSLEEQEANLFAASLLMPRNLFRAEMEVYRDPMHLAAKFLVSLTAARVRMDYLANNSY